MKRDKVVVVALLTVAVSSLIILTVEGIKRRESPKPNCVEQPSAALPLKNVTVHGRTGYLSVCGIRDRAGLPSVVQCYELKDGCTE